MRKYRKILLLLPFLSNAMPGKNSSENVGKTPTTNCVVPDLPVVAAADGALEAVPVAELALAQLARPRVSMTFDIWVFTSEFIRNARSLLSLMSTCTNILNGVSWDQSDELNKIRIDSPDGCRRMRVLYPALRIFPANRFSMDCVLILNRFSERVKAGREHALLEGGKYDKQINLAMFGPRVEVPAITTSVAEGLHEDMLDPSKDENYLQNMCRLGCIQEGLKKLCFRKGLLDEKLLEDVKEFVSKFEYVTTKMVAAETSENLKLKSELAEKIQKDICFIVRQYDTIDFANLCGDKISEIDIIMLIEDANQSLNIPFSPRSLRLYALKPVNITKNKILKDLRVMNLPKSLMGNPFLFVDRFLFQCSGLTDLDLGPLNQVTRISNNFLSYCSGLTSLDLSPLSQVKFIGTDFLSGCSGLTSLDLSPLSQVKFIGTDFLAGCSGLTSLDLSPLSQIKYIGNYFLEGCSGLTSLDLSNLNQIVAVENNFLKSCKSLTNIDLTPLNRITSVGEDFLSETGLTSLDLTPLNSVTQVGDRFLARCTELTSLDLNPLNKITCIGRDFLEQCSGLINLDLNPLSQLRSIGNNFLKQCRGLTSIKLESFNQVEFIGVDFLYDCHNLINLDLTSINQVTTIRKNFLSGCRSLINVNLNLSRVTHIESEFLSSCSELTEVNLSSLKQVTEVEGNFLSGCRGLTSLDLSPLNKITKIEDRFLSSCQGLTSLDLSSLNKVTRIGSNFLDWCLKLTSLNLSGFENVNRIELGFLQSCCGLLKRENVETGTLSTNHPIVQALNRALGQLK